MLRIFNTLAKTIEDFVPVHSPHVNIYSCGPTVYDYQHIGHMRRYVGDDILLRVLRLNGYEVKHAMNITDVGHLVSDDDSGEDKMEKGARKFGKTVWEIAKEFEQQFKDSCESLNITLPKDLMHATDYIKEQITLVEILEKKGFTYKISDGIYFDSAKLLDYGKLTGQKAEDLRAGARVEMVAGKKHPTDFALWKFDLGRARNGLPERAMNWWFKGKHAGELLINRPASKEDLDIALKRWFDASESEKETIGFPGWHIECSAMAMNALGNTLDIHTGGIDHIPVHHTNEIAQSEAATGEQFVRYWVHHNFLLVEGEKMSKSLGNTYTVHDVVDKGFDPMALRYLYLQTHYRQEMNFTWESLKAAQNTLDRLKEQVASKHTTGSVLAEYKQRFVDAVNDDMNMPKALAVVWELMKSEESDGDKATTVRWFDLVLGLELFTPKTLEIPQSVFDLIEKRKEYRLQKNYAKSDELRDEILGLGYEVLDEENGEVKVKKVH